MDQLNGKTYDEICVLFKRAGTLNAPDVQLIVNSMNEVVKYFNNKENVIPFNTSLSLHLVNLILFPAMKFEPEIWGSLSAGEQKSIVMKVQLNGGSISRTFDELNTSMQLIYLNEAPHKVEDTIIKWELFFKELGYKCWDYGSYRLSLSPYHDTIDKWLKHLRSTFTDEKLKSRHEMTPKNNETDEAGFVEMKLSNFNQKLVLLNQLGIIDHLISLNKNQLENRPTNLASLLALILGISDKEKKSFIASVKHLLNNSEKTPVNDTALRNIKAELFKIGIDLASNKSQIKQK